MYVLTYVQYGQSADKNRLIRHIWFLSHQSDSGLIGLCQSAYRMHQIITYVGNTENLDNGRHLVCLSTIKDSCKRRPGNTTYGAASCWWGSGMMGLRLRLRPLSFGLLYIVKKSKIDVIIFIFSLISRSHSRSRMLLVQFRYEKMMWLRFWLWHLSFGLYSTYCKKSKIDIKFLIYHYIGQST
jgi:hypothetical protein